jgi:hypothetical protein
MSTHADGSFTPHKRRMGINWMQLLAPLSFPAPPSPQISTFPTPPFPLPRQPPPRHPPAMRSSSPRYFIS